MMMKKKIMILKSPLCLWLLVSTWCGMVSSSSAYVPSTSSQSLYVTRQQQQQEFSSSGCSSFTKSNGPQFHGKSTCHAATALSLRGGQQLKKRVIIPTAKTMKDLMVLNLGTNPALASLVAGSIAGALGVGVAFPLDTLKTKSQVIRSQQRLANKNKPLQNTDSTATASTFSMNADDMNMLQLISLIYKTEGIAGFFGGVKGMMVGQAIIKSVAFSANAIALTWLQQHHVGDTLSPTVALVLAAMYSGFVTSFLVAPIERIKVMMQADSTKYDNEFECIKAILQASGITGLFSRGLGPTLAREVPSYGIYFFVYGFLMTTPLANWLGATAPLIFGALTGMACWVPVYPIDVVKTLVQNNDGSDNDEDSTSSWKVAQNLYQERGIGGFFDGLTPKMLRAAVNHSVTFFVYDLILQWLTQGAAAEL